ncbi:MAG: hypothetical protein KF788_04970 [Piscinibacter sp.]|nr:hypothetical protein [Piscinibacter sp.]
MVAIVGGNGLGLFNASLNVLGGVGVTGESVLGQGGTRLMVNAVTGNLISQSRDEGLSGRGLDLAHLRTYNSLGEWSDGDGDGWRWLGERQLKLTVGAAPNEAGSVVTRVDGDGHESAYSFDGGVYVCSEGAGAHDSLQYADGQWIWTEGSSRLQEVYSYDSASKSGRLERQIDASGNSVVFGYDGSGRLSSLTDEASGQKIVLSYAAVGGAGSAVRLSKVETYALVEDAQGRATATLGVAIQQVSYGYDSVGRLVSVSTDLSPGADNSTADGKVYVTSYTYENPSDPASQRIASITQSDGTQVYFSYYADGRIKTVQDSTDVLSKYLQFSYNDSANSTDITNGVGEVWTYTYDADKRLKSIEAPVVGGAQRLKTSFNYDAQGNVTSVVDAQGQAITYGYDANGNRTLEVDAAGNTIKRVYDADNQLVIETRYKTPDPDGVGGAGQPGGAQSTRYVYDEHARLRFTVSAEGRVSENVYDAVTGLLKQARRYASSFAGVAGAPESTPLSQAQLSQWVGQLGAAELGETMLSDFEYDLRGNLSRQVDYASVDGSGAGVLDATATVTEYISDAHGQLRQTIAVRGQARDQRSVLSSYGYDGLGRLTSSSGSAGTQVTAYLDAQRKIEVTSQATGLVQTRTYDSRGRLTSQLETGDGVSRATAKYVYDNAGRLRMSEDAQGQRRFNFYDAAGRLSYTVDAQGAVTGMEYTDAGMLSRQTRYRNTVSAAAMAGWYDGAVVTKVSLSVGASGADLLSDAQDRVRQYGYDAANRLSTLTDELGVESTTVYDGLSQVTAMRTGERISRVLYDRDGRQVGSVDAQGYLSENVYDAAGRLVKTVRYSERGKLAGDQSAPIWLGAQAQTAVAGRPFEHRLGAVDGDADVLKFSVLQLPDWLSFDVQALTLSGVPPQGAKTATVSLRASDQRGRFTDVSFDVVVTESGPSWGEIGDIAAQQGAVFTGFELPAANDEIGLSFDLTYSILGPLPQGMVFDPMTRGVYSLPTQPGVYMLTARVTDGQGRYTDRSFSVTIAAPGGDKQWAPMGPVTVATGSPIVAVLPPVQAPAGQVLTYTKLSGPSWLTVGSDGTLGGTPGVTGREAVEVQVSGGGSSVRLRFEMNVQGPAMSWSPAPVVVSAGVASSVTVAAASGTSPSYSVVGGLPAGFSFDAATRVLTAGAGTAAGFYTLVLRATDAGGQSIERMVAVQVKAPVVTGGVVAASDDIAAWRPDDTSGLSSHLYYDGQGRVVGVVDERGFLSETVYDAAGNKQQSRRYLEAVTVVAGDTLATLKGRAGAQQTTTLEYDLLGRLSKTTTLDGTAGATVTHNLYDDAGRMVREVRAEGSGVDERASRIRYNAFGEVTGRVDGRGDEAMAQQSLSLDEAIEQYGTRYQYDSLGRLNRTVDANGHATLYYYDRENRLTHTVDAQRQVSQTEYSAFGQVQATRRYATQMEQASYDALLADASLGIEGKLPGATAADQVSRYDYDKRGQVLSITDPANVVAQTYVYDQYGQLVGQTRALGTGKLATDQFDYDLRGQLVASTSDVSGVNLRSRMEYDAFGRVTRSFDGAGKQTRTEYDDSGRTVVVTDPLNRERRTEYDAFGRVFRDVDGLGNATTYEYDDAARRMTMSTPQGVSVSTEYNRHGQVLGLTDGRGNTTRYEYDKNGALTKVTDPLQGLSQTVYDKSGRVFQTIDARGTVVEFAYDSVNRVFQRRVDPEGLNLVTQYEFNALDQQVKVTEALGTGVQRVSSYAYEAHGWLQQLTQDDVSGGLKLYTRYGYDLQGNVVRVEQGAGTQKLSVSLVEFDGANRRVKETVAPSAEFGAGVPGSRDITTQYRYDAAGRVSRRIDANGHSTWYVYDAAGQQTHVIDELGEVRESHYDDDGRVVFSRTYLSRLDPNVVQGFGDAVHLSSGVGDVASAFKVPAEDDGDARSRIVYDQDGRVRFALTAVNGDDWRLSETRYDDNGNAVEVRGYDQFIAQSWIDAHAGVQGLQLQELIAQLGALGYDDGDSATLSQVQRTRYVYDANNRLRYSLDALGHVTESRYDAGGNITSVERFAGEVDPGGQLSEASLDAAVGGLRGQAGNQVQRTVYDALGRVKYQVRVLQPGASGQNLIRRNGYDELGRLVKTTEYATAVALADDSEASLEAALAAVESDPNNRISALVYDAGDRLAYSVQVLSSNGAGQPDRSIVVQHGYDALGREVVRTEYARELTQALDGLDKATLDAAVAAAGLADAGADRKTYTVYDAAGRQRYVVSANDGVSLAVGESRYDAAGNVVELRRYDKAVTSAAVAALDTTGSPGLSEAEAQALLRALGYNDSYPATLAQVQREHYAYDADNQLRFTVDATGAVTQRVYDALGQVVRTVSHARRPTLSGYSEAQVAAALDDVTAVDQVTHYAYDAGGQLRFTLHKQGGGYLASETRYDGLGRAVEVRGYAQALTTLGVLFDEASVAQAAQAAQSAQDRRSVSVYDAAGRVVYSVDKLTAAGEYRISERQLDALDQVIGERSYAKAAVLAGAVDADTVGAAVQAPGFADAQRDRVAGYAYDAAGRQVYAALGLNVDAADGKLRYGVSKTEYDALNQAVKKTDFATALKLVSFDGSKIDAALVVDAARDAVSASVYDAAGRMTYGVRSVSLDAADGQLQYQVSQIEYDCLGRVRSQIARASAVKLSSIDAETIDAAVLASAQDRKSVFVYDAGDKVRFTLQADQGDQWIVSENRYDPSGNVVETRRYDQWVKTDWIDANDTSASPGISEQELGSKLQALGYDDADEGTLAGVRRTRMAYDLDGRLRFMVDALGTVSEQTYDSFGQVTGRIEYAQRPALSVYDEVHIAAALDGANPANRVQRLAYDALGRMVYSARLVQAGTGSYVLEKTDYDALSRVSQHTAFAELVQLGAFDDAAINAAVVASAQDRKTAMYYDAGGRQRFTVGADDAFGETLYDALDRVTESRQFDFKVTLAAGDRSEAKLQTLRGSHAVGDGSTRGETYDYDAGGRRIGLTDAAGFSESLAYDALGNLRSRVDKKGNTWTYAYDQLGRKVKESTPPLRFQLAGETQPPATDRTLETHFVYDALGDLKQRIEAANTADARTTDFEYDRQGRLTKTSQPGWYDAQTGQVEGSDAVGRFRRETQLTYDALGNTVRTRTRTGVDSYQYEYSTYDALGQLLHQVDALNHVSAFAYNSFGEQKTLSRYGVTLGGAPADGVSWRAEEVAAQLEGDARARTITMSYDNLGRKTEVRQPQVASYYYGSTQPVLNSDSVSAVSAQAITQFEYNAFGEVHRERIQLDDSQWRDTWHYHDVMGREVRSIDALGYHTAYAYDVLGNLTQKIEYAVAGALGSDALTAPGVPVDSDEDRITGIVYDTLNRQSDVRRYNLTYAKASGELESTGRNGYLTTQHQEYDALGNVRASTDAAGHVTAMDYDALGRLIRVTEPARLVAKAGAVDAFAAGNQVLVSPVTTLTTDAFGNVRSSQRDPGGQGAGGVITTSQAFDHAGNLVSNTDANGNVTHFQLDYAGRVIRQTLHIDVDLDNPGAYGGKGQLGTTEHTIERRFAYDALGRQLAATDVFVSEGDEWQSGQRVVYNAFGEVAEEQRVWGEAGSAPLGAALEGLLSAKAASYTYDDAGHRLTKTAADGLTRYYYDLAGLLTRQEQRGNDSSSDGTVARVTETGYDLLGRAVIQRLPSFSASFATTQDTMLEQAVTPFVEQSFDRWGNVLSNSTGGFVANADGTVDTAQRAVTNYLYNHDNQLIKEAAPKVRAYHTKDGGLEEDYDVLMTHELRYDRLGREVAELDWAENAGTSQAVLQRERHRQYEGSGAQLSQETDATGINTYYLYDAHGRRVATKNNLGTVFVDAYDDNGNVLSHGVLRDGEGRPYISGSAQTPVVRWLQYYQYDQANRRYASADNLKDDGSYVVWSYTQYDGRGLVHKTSKPGNAFWLTVSEYDALGNKTSESTDGYTKSWSYSLLDENHVPVDDYTVGRLLTSHDSGDVTLVHSYNDFGQLSAQTELGQSTSLRQYQYHDNGLLRQIDSSFSSGTVGQADAFGFDDISSYGYTVKGELAKETLLRSGWRGAPTNYLPTITKTTYTTYDARGRTDRVWADDQNTGNALERLNYFYDELGNTHKVYALYNALEYSSHRYAYDAEGRLTRDLDERVEQQAAGTGETVLTYDGLGRRATSFSFDKAEQTAQVAWESGDHDGHDYAVFTWDGWREQRYGYDDLGYLTDIDESLIHRHIVERDYDVDEIYIQGNPTGTYTTTQVGSALGHSDIESAYVNIDHRDNSVRGEVQTQRLSALKDTDWGGAGTSEPATTIENVYLPAGELYSRRTSQTVNGKTHTVEQFYNYHVDGSMDWYSHSESEDGNPLLRNEFHYAYSDSSSSASRQEVSVTEQSGAQQTLTGITVNYYDGLGQLVSKKATVFNDSGSADDKVTESDFAYDNQGRIVLESQRIDDAGTSSSGVREYYFANGHQVGMLGNGTLESAQFDFAYTPISAAYPGSSPGSYSVRSGDTLQSIAAAVWGDQSLWYLIADANSLNFQPGEALPSEELGKNYRIPNVVAGSHYNASTFAPYSVASIISSGTSGIHLPPPPPTQCVSTQQLLSVALVVAVSVVVTAFTGGAAAAALQPLGSVLAGAVGGAVGAAGGALAGQVVANGGIRDLDVNWSQVGVGAGLGALGGALSGVAGTEAVKEALQGSLAKGAWGLGTASVQGFASVAANGGNGNAGSLLGWLGAGVNGALGSPLGTAGLIGSQVGLSLGESALAANSWNSFALSATQAVTGTLVGLGLGLAQDHYQRRAQEKQYQMALAQAQSIETENRALRLQHQGVQEYQVVIAGNEEENLDIIPIRKTAEKFKTTCIRTAALELCSNKALIDGVWHYVDGGARFNEYHYDYGEVPEELLTADEEADEIAYAQINEVGGLGPQKRFAIKTVSAAEANLRSRAAAVRKYRPQPAPAARTVSQTLDTMGARITLDVPADSQVQRATPLVMGMQAIDAEMVIEEALNELTYQHEQAALRDRDLRAVQARADEWGLSVEQVLDGEHQYRKGFLVSVAATIAEPFLMARDAFIPGSRKSNYAQEIAINRRINDGPDWQDEASRAATKAVAFLASTNTITQAAWSAIGSGLSISEAIDKGVTREGAGEFVANIATALLIRRALRSGARFDYKPRQNGPTILGGSGPTMGTPRLVETPEYTSGPTGGRPAVAGQIMAPEKPIRTVPYEPSVIVDPSASTPSAQSLSPYAPERPYLRLPEFDRSLDGNIFGDPIYLHGGQGPAVAFVSDRDKTPKGYFPQDYSIGPELAAQPGKPWVDLTARERNIISRDKFEKWSKEWEVPEAVTGPQLDNSPLHEVQTSEFKQYLGQGAVKMSFLRENPELGRDTVVSIPIADKVLVSDRTANSFMHDGRRWSWGLYSPGLIALEVDGMEKIASTGQVSHGYIGRGVTSGFPFRVGKHGVDVYPEKIAPSIEYERYMLGMRDLSKRRVYNDEREVVGFRFPDEFEVNQGHLDDLLKLKEFTRWHTINDLQGGFTKNGFHVGDPMGVMLNHPQQTWEDSGGFSIPQWLEYGILPNSGLGFLDNVIRSTGNHLKYGPEWHLDRALVNMMLPIPQ